MPLGDRTAAAESYISSRTGWRGSPPACWLSSWPRGPSVGHGLRNRCLALESWCVPTVRRRIYFDGRNSFWRSSGSQRPWLPLHISPTSLQRVVCGDVGAVSPRPSAFWRRGGPSCFGATACSESPTKPDLRPSYEQDGQVTFDGADCRFKGDVQEVGVRTTEVLDGEFARVEPAERRF